MKPVGQPEQPGCSLKRHCTKAMNYILDKYKQMNMKPVGQCEQAGCSECLKRHCTKAGGGGGGGGLGLKEWQALH